MAVSTIKHVSQTKRVGWSESAEAPPAGRHVRRGARVGRAAIKLLRSTGRQLCLSERVCVFKWIELSGIVGNVGGSSVETQEVIFFASAASGLIRAKSDRVHHHADATPLENTQPVYFWQTECHGAGSQTQGIGFKIKYSSFKGNQRKD